MIQDSNRTPHRPRFFSDGARSTLGERHRTQQLYKHEGLADVREPVPE